MNTQMINFMIPTTLLKQVDAYAKVESTSRSDFLRDAVRNYLDKMAVKRELIQIRNKSLRKSQLNEEEAIALAEEAKKWARANFK